MKIPNKIEYLTRNLPPEFTSAEAEQALSPFYKSPNKLLENLVAKGALIRLKRGLFVSAAHYNPLAAAGSIHGPSYLSFETALAYYGLIPEQVTTIMAVVDGRQLQIEAGEHLYIYRSQERTLFAKGMTAVTMDGRNVLIATPEKAMLDTIAWSGFNTKHTNQSDLFDYLKQSYRLADEGLLKLSCKKMTVLAPMYRSLAPGMFVNELIQRISTRR